MTSPTLPNTALTGSRRWLIALMGTLLQLCLGTVYAWSYFQKPLVDQFGWSNGQVAWTFSLAICFLGLAAAWGGVQLPRFGPRRLAMAGALLYAAGNGLAGLALQLRSLPLLLLGYGVIGGIGLGLGYVTPVATVAKWFPDKKGLVTGMVVMGFGLGALLQSKLIAPVLMQLCDENLVLVFLMIGAVILGVSLPAAACLRNPPGEPSAPGQAPVPPPPANWPEIRSQLLSSRFIRMWLIFFCNISAGIMFIGFQSPMLQDLLKTSDPGLDASALALAGATLIAISSLFNGLGRLLWGGISDRIGRLPSFRLILGSQILVFLLLTQTDSPVLFGILVCYILLCYGGGFGAMPSLVLDSFGSTLMPVMYGVILTAWSMAGITGPQIVAFIRDQVPANQIAPWTFGAVAVLVAIGCTIAFSLKPAAENRT